VVSLLGSVRRRVLTPSMSETKLSTRGFFEKSPAARDLLETIGASFLTGYGHAAQASRPARAEAGLERIPDRFRGFAYEGAGMGFAVRDGLPFGGKRHVERFLQGAAAEHGYMVYVGVGWAMARVPRFRWSSMYTADPLLKWLVLDGFGFHQAYFRTERYVREQYQEPDFPWPGQGWSWYADRVIDQGIGRALWFVCGTEPGLVADTIAGFAEERQADLYSGAGLAATYAGGVDRDELLTLWDRADKYRVNVAQGSAFAASARVEAGLDNEHTVLATRLLCGVTPQEATWICRDVRPDPVLDTHVPAYEVWRCRIAERFAAHAAV
jgi:enediyne biosynthesis protein E3